MSNGEISDKVIVNVMNHQYLFLNVLGNNRVQILNSTLQHELSISSDGDDSAFDRPNDVCIDKNGMIIVADTFR